MKYYPMHMHLHTIHQPGASMESHMHNAAALGMKYIRFTDHDSRTGIGEKSVTHFDFSRGALEYVDERRVLLGWQPLGDGQVDAEVGAIKLAANGSSAAISFFSAGRKHTVSLLADVALTLEFTHECDAESAIVLDVTLSQRPPDHKEAHYRYVIGKYDTLDCEHCFTHSIQPSANGVYRLKLSEDIAKCAEVGGLDNVFATLSVIAVGNASLSLTRFEIERKYGYDEVIQRQRALGAKIGEKYGITPFITTEISGAGQHKNCFTSTVPVINYQKSGSVSEAEAIEHVKRHGGIFSYNHPFDAAQYKKRQFTREQIDEIVADRTRELIENRALGAAAVEVGFPEGRGLFTLLDYLKLWDNLSLAGLFITGDGDSDCHKSHELWFSGNNFATWLGVDASLAHPISEEIFNLSLVSGNAYMGDPLLIPKMVAFCAEGAKMGSVIKVKKEKYTVSLKLTDTAEGMSVRFIVNGKCVSIQATHAGDYQAELTVVPSGTVSFARAELYSADRCVMLTNPIYFVSDDFAGIIPKERLAEI